MTSVFTTLKYYPTNRDLFVQRLLRYARTIPHEPAGVLIFQYVSVLKRQDRFDFHPVAEYVVDVARAAVSERVLDPSISVSAAAATSRIHEAARPGTYAPLRP